MYFGTLAIRSPRKESSCAFCKEEIQLKVESPYILYRNVGPEKKSFTINLHWWCIEGWCKKNKDERNLARESEKKPGRKMGRPNIGLPPDKLKARKRVQYYLYVAKGILLRNYVLGDMDKVQQGWWRIGELFQRMEEIGGSNNKYHLGQDASEIIVPREDLRFIKALVDAEGEVGNMIQVIKEFKGERPIH